MEDINKKPTYEIIKELSFLDQDINLKIMKFNILTQEILKRFPDLAKEEMFAEKSVIKK